jgi:hypothetical protein
MFNLPLKLSLNGEFFLWVLVRGGLGFKFRSSLSLSLGVRFKFKKNSHTSYSDGGCLDYRDTDPIVYR